MDLNSLTFSASAERVARGAAWLDSCTHPAAKEWWKKVDLDTLNMDFSNRCILGQIFANCASSYSTGYGWALANLFGRDCNNEESYGFVRSSDTAEWKRVIRERLEQDKAPTQAAAHVPADALDVDAIVREFAADLQTAVEAGTMTGKYSTLGFCAEFAKALGL